MLLRRTLLSRSAPLALLALAGCGGGSGGSPTTGTPAPTAGATPLPSPTPTPTSGSIVDGIIDVITAPFTPTPSPAPSAGEGVTVVPAPEPTPEPTLEPAPVPAPAPAPAPAPEPDPTPTPAPAPVASPTPESYANVPTGDPCTRVLGINYTISSLEKPAYSCTMLARNTVQRFEVRSGDRGWSGDARNRNERSEIVTTALWSSQRSLLFKSNVETWLSFGFMVEPGEEIGGRWAMVGQMHPVPDATDGSPPPSFNFQIGTSSGDRVPLYLMTRGDPNRDTPVAPAAVTRWSTTLTRGRWINLVMRLRFDPFGGGEIQLWADGVEQVNLSGIPMGYNNATDGQYWQYGIYRMETTKTLAVRYANMEQGPASLARRVADPLPIP